MKIYKEAYQSKHLPGWKAFTKEEQLPYFKRKGELIDSVGSLLEEEQQVLILGDKYAGKSSFAYYLSQKLENALFVDFQKDELTHNKVKDKEYLILDNVEEIIEHPQHIKVVSEIVKVFKGRIVVFLTINTLEKFEEGELLTQGKQCLFPNLDYEELQQHARLILEDEEFVLSYTNVFPIENRLAFSYLLKFCQEEVKKDQNAKTLLNNWLNEHFLSLSSEDQMTTIDLFKSLVDFEVKKDSSKRVSLEKLEEGVPNKSKLGQVISYWEQLDCLRVEQGGVSLDKGELINLWDKLSYWAEEERNDRAYYQGLLQNAKAYKSGAGSLLINQALAEAVTWMKESRNERKYGAADRQNYELVKLYLEVCTQEEERIAYRQKVLGGRRRMGRTIASSLLGAGAVIAFLFYLYGKKQQLYAEKQQGVAEEAKELALIEQGKAEESAQEAERQSNIARKKEAEAQQSAYLAMKEKRNAQAQATLAKERQIQADSARNQALKSKEIADEANSRAGKLRILSIARSMAVKSLQISDVALKGVMAQQAYYFNYENGGDLLDPDVYNAMYFACKKIKGDTYNKLYGHRATVRDILTINGVCYSIGSDGRVMKYGAVENPTSGKLILERKEYLHKTMCYASAHKSLYIAGGYNKILRIDLNTLKVTQFDNPDRDAWNLTPMKGGEVVLNAVKNRVAWYEQGKLIKHISFPGKINTSTQGKANNEVFYGLENGNLVRLSQTKELKVLKSFPFPIHSLKYNAQRNILAVGLENGNIVLLNATSFAQINQLKQHKARVNNLAFSRDGKRLASSSFDKTVCLWDMDNQYAPPVVLNDHSDWVWSLTFSPDGTYLLAGCKDKLIRRWPTTIEGMNSVVCQSNEIAKNMTCIEWENYVGKDIDYTPTCPSKEVPCIKKAIP